MCLLTEAQSNRVKPGLVHVCPLTMGHYHVPSIASVSRFADCFRGPATSWRLCPLFMWISWDFIRFSFMFPSICIPFNICINQKKFIRYQNTRYIIPYDNFFWPSRMYKIVMQTLTRIENGRSLCMHSALFIYFLVRKTNRNENRLHRKIWRWKNPTKKILGAKAEFPQLKGPPVSCFDITASNGR